MTELHFNPRSASFIALASIVLLCSSGCFSSRLIREAADMNARGTVLLARGDVHGAEAAFRVALEYNERFSEPHNNLGLVALQQSRIFDARRHFRAAIDRNRDFAEAWSNLGAALLRTYVGDDRRAATRDAERAFRESLSINPGLSEARINLVRLLLERNETHDALSQSRRLVQIAESMPVAHALRAAAALAAGSMPEALASSARARELAADDPDALMISARIAILHGDVDAAEQWLETIRHDGRLGIDARALLAAVFHATGRTNEALSELRALGARAIDHPTARGVLRAIEQRSASGR